MSYCNCDRVYLPSQPPNQETPKMVRKSNENIPAFVLKCYDMVDDPSTDSIIFWGPNDDSFIVSDTANFTADLLPNYFKHSKFPSFQRQLNLYGFRKTSSDRWEFAHEAFIKDQKHLLKYISKKRSSPATEEEKPSELPEDDVFSKQNKDAILWKEVESLKIDKNVLMQELVKQRQHQENSQNKLIVLREQLKGMEKNQQQMLSFIVMAMQSPGFLEKLLQPIGNNWHVAEEDFDGSLVPFDGTIVSYRQPNEGGASPLVHIPSYSDDLLELDNTSDDDFFKNIDFGSGPYDEKLGSTENVGPFVLPDLPDSDSMMDKLLDSSSSFQTDENTKLDTEYLTQGFEKSLNMRSDTTAVETLPGSSSIVGVLDERRNILESEKSSNYRTSFPRICERMELYSLP